MIDNPVGISGIGHPESSRLGLIGFGLLLFLVIEGMGSVIVRYPRSAGKQRHQIKGVLLPAYWPFCRYSPKR